MDSQERIPNLEQIILEKRKVGAFASMHPQVAHDLDLKVIEDWLEDTLVFRLQSEVMSYKDGEDRQEVWSEVEVLPHKRYILALTAAIVLLGSGLLIAGLPYLGALGYAFAVIVCAAYVWSRPIRERKAFTVKAEKWLRFPENTMVFPKELGIPIIQIMTEVERNDES